MGTKDKFWVALDGEEWLFKFSRSDGLGGVRNEDWAEWIVYHLALELGIPAAVVRPGTCDGRRGILSRSVMRDRTSERLVHGNELLTNSFMTSIATINLTSRERTRATPSSMWRRLSAVSALPVIKSK